MTEYKKRSYFVRRKEALTMEEVVEEFIKSAKLASGLNTQRVFAAWDECSGAGPFTLKRYFRSGTLYVTLSSSVILRHLEFFRHPQPALLPKRGAHREDERLSFRRFPFHGRQPHNRLRPESGAPLGDDDLVGLIALVRQLFVPQPEVRLLQLRVRGLMLQSEVHEAGNGIVDGQDVLSLGS